MATPGMLHDNVAVAGICGLKEAEMPGQLVLCRSATQSAHSEMGHTTHLPAPNLATAARS